MEIVADITVLRLELRQRVAVFQGNKFLIGVQHILITAGFLVCRVCVRFLRGPSVRRGSLLAPGLCNAFYFLLIDFLHQPVEMDAFKITSCLLLTVCHRIKPFLRVGPVGRLSRLNRLCVEGFPGFLILLRFRNRCKHRGRMPVAEGFVIVVTMSHRLGCPPVLPGHKGSNLAEPIPDHRIVCMVTGVRLPALIDMYRPVLFPVNLPLIVKAFVKDKARARKRLSRFMIVFIHLYVIGGSKILCVAEYMENRLCHF
ncbi:unknown [Clostridium sp. CAG:149]|nr:unknown [Clostridium sp. CAG:149]